MLWEKGDCVCKFSPSMFFWKKRMGSIGAFKRGAKSKKYKFHLLETRALFVLIVSLGVGIIGRCALIFCSFSLPQFQCLGRDKKVAFFVCI